MRTLTLLLVLATLVGCDETTAVVESRPQPIDGFAIWCVNGYEYLFRSWSNGVAFTPRYIYNHPTDHPRRCRPGVHYENQQTPYTEGDKTE